jgi:hypothetical protein
MISLVLTFWCMICPSLGQAPEPFVYIQVPSAYGGRLIVWTAGDRRYVLEQPIVLQVAPAPGKPQTILQLGFIHSGYSAEDPDGRNAVLNVTVEMVKKPLTEKERQNAWMENLIINDTVRVLAPSEWWLDVVLPASMEEEARLRKALQLPRRLQADSSLPLSCRWQGVAGKVLAGWLTDPVKGLAFVLRPDDKSTDALTVRWDVGRRFQLAKEGLQEWWKKRAGEADTFRWVGGINLLAHDLLANGAVLADGAKVGLALSDADIRELHKRLQDISEDDKPGVMSVSKEKLFSLPSWTATSGVDTKVTRLPLVQPGATLEQNPVLIKDLSGDSKGLDALKKDPMP